MSSRAVYVRGVGAVSALGPDWETTRARLAAGESGVTEIRRFDTTGFPCRVGAPVEAMLSATGDARLALALPAAREAWSAARVDVHPARIGVFLGAESGRISLQGVVELTRAAGAGESFDHARFAHAALALASSVAPCRTSPAATAAALAREIDARGPVQTVSLACASSSAAVVEAVRAIRLGVCDVALAGGVGADVDPLMFAGFGLLGALSERGRSCPFDVRRDGFVVGEGAAMLVLARERGDAACAVLGIGRSLDAWRITAPDPEGRGTERAMRCALEDAGVASIDYVQAHGTSTPLNDAIEALALRRVLGARADDAHVSSVKGALGHWIAGAGALGLLCAHEAITHGVLLPTAGLLEPDPECDLRHVRGTALRASVQRALCNALAFGGANCSVVLGAAA